LVNGYISHRRYHTVGLCPPSPLPEWFAEEFDTVDLKDAKSLLDQLSA
jgi:hypothetical protein